MQNHSLRFGLGIMLVAFLIPELMCETGVASIDMAINGAKNYREVLWYRDIVKGEAEEHANGEQQVQVPPPAPQGEFVRPVAPIVPQAQPVAPAAQPPAAATGPHAPVILSIDYPETIPADTNMHYGWLSFTDAGGDVTEKRSQIVGGSVPMQGSRSSAQISGSPTAGRVRIGYT